MEEYKLYKTHSENGNIFFSITVPATVTLEDVQTLDWNDLKTQVCINVAQCYGDVLDQIHEDYVKGEKIDK